MLRSVLVNHLAKIAMLVEQPTTGTPRSLAALSVIAGHIAKPARVNRERFAQHEIPWSRETVCRMTHAF
jgi:hypothetical protein